MVYETLLYEKRESIATVTLNRPAKLNALNHQMVEDLSAFLDALNLPKAVFVGHSFGGCILQHFAVRYPARLQALILSNTNACNLIPQGITAGVQARLDGYGTEAQNREIFSRTVPRYFDPANVSAGLRRTRH